MTRCWVKGPALYGRDDCRARAAAGTVPMITFARPPPSIVSPGTAAPVVDRLANDVFTNDQVEPFQRTGWRLIRDEGRCECFHAGRRGPGRAAAQSPVQELSTELGVRTVDRGEHTVEIEIGPRPIIDGLHRFVAAAKLMPGLGDTIVIKTGNWCNGPPRFAQPREPFAPTNRRLRNGDHAAEHCQHRDHERDQHDVSRRAR